jgi:hypothetical protein
MASVKDLKYIGDMGSQVAECKEMMVHAVPVATLFSNSVSRYVLFYPYQQGAQVSSRCINFGVYLVE